MRCMLAHPQALLLVQGTDTGKSAVAWTIGCVNYGATSTIDEKLAISANQPTNQHSKVATAQ